MVMLTNTMEQSRHLEGNGCPANEEAHHILLTTNLLLCTQELATNAYAEPDKSSPHPPVIFPQYPF